jgi:hypothetical protein
MAIAVDFATLNNSDDPGALSFDRERNGDGRRAYYATSIRSWAGPRLPRGSPL